MIILEGDASLLEQNTRPSNDEILEIFAAERGVTRQNALYADTASKIGDLPALIMLTNKNSKSSTSGFLYAVEVIAGIAHGEPILYDAKVQLSDYRASSASIRCIGGFLKDDYDNLDFGFSIEERLQRNQMRDGAKGEIFLDLVIRMGAWVVSPVDRNSYHEIACVVVEFDGPHHLISENVRDDKYRDSMLQSLGRTVFRVQNPLKAKGPGSARRNREEMKKLLSFHIEDIREHFRHSLYRNIKLAKALSSSVSKN